MMYEKNLTEDLRLRLTEQDMNFLRELSSERETSVSACIRSIIGEYRRSLDTISKLTKALNITEGEGTAVHSDTKTDFNNQL